MEHRLVPEDLQLPSSPVREKLYVSHFLSTWNARVFEFGAVLFVSSIYPNTLLPASVYALSRSAAAVVFSSAAGSFIDHGNRMHVVRVSILGQRIATAVSCILLLLMTLVFDMHTLQAKLAFAVLSLLACVEKVAFVMNTIAIERDWVVVVASGHDRDLQELNAQMRRIDLFCKLVGPLAIALLTGFSLHVAILAVLTTTTASVVVEYVAIAKVYNSVPDLQAPRNHPISPSASNQPLRPTGLLSSVKARVVSSLRELQAYFNHSAFLPSFALALLYLTVLSFNGQMVAYLLSTDFSSTSIGLLRTLSTICELSATWLAPRTMDRIGAVRAGIWFLNWQIACLALAVGMLWANIPPEFASAGFLAAVVLSRIGLWGFDLSAQMVVQEEVEPSHRGSFSALEASFQNAFELCSFASTIAFARPEQFRYPATISAGATVCAGVLYALFVRHRRGHLLHASRCLTGRLGDRFKGRRPRGESGREEWIELPQEEPRNGEDGEESG